MFEEKGVEFRLSAGVKELKGTDGKVHGIYLNWCCHLVFCSLASSLLLS